MQNRFILTLNDKTYILNENKIEHVIVTDSDIHIVMSEKVVIRISKSKNEKEYNQVKNNYLGEPRVRSL